MTDKSMGRPAKIALIQQGPLSDQKEANFDALIAKVEKAAENGAQFIMPTELSLTPYFAVVRDRKLEAWAETLDGNAVAAFSKIAKKHQTTIIFPVYLRSENDVYENTAIVIGPDGEVVTGEDRDGTSHNYFSKIHLPDAWHKNSGLAEPFYFKPGDALPVFDTPLGRIGILICYDRRFPEAWRSLALSGAEIIFMPSCVPAWSPAASAATAEMFTIELQTRACENAIFVAACNRSGVEEFAGVSTNFVGNSCLIGPGGTMLEHLSDADEGIIEAEIDLDHVAKVRSRLTVLRDRRPDVYGKLN
jgi:beta-ureidopropionase